MRLQGTSVLLTGASGGIGRSIARARHASGASLKLSGRRVEMLDELREALGERAESLPADLSDAEQVRGLAERAGTVDGLVANAGLPASGRLEAFVPSRSTGRDVNLRAPIQLARALRPRSAGRRRRALPRAVPRTRRRGEQCRRARADERARG